MHTLTPEQAAEIATGVYDLRARSVAQVKASHGAPLGAERMFKITDNSRFTGLSGAGIKRLSGFGYIAEGEGEYRGEVLCVTRGTSTLYDWASNLNVGVQQGPSGQLVHAGFNEVWKSYRSEIDAFMQRRSPAHVHCVGHSLGGALAFLNADYFASRKLPCSVYTFGAPRTGIGWFAGELTKQISCDRIFRTSHVADPVPMIPIFPFVHAPTPGWAYRVGASKGDAFISISAHSMDGSYFERVAGKSWRDLRHAETEVTDFEVQSWLGETAHGDGVFANSAMALVMIGRLLRWIMRKAGSLLAGTAGLGLTAGFTLLDQLAGVIERGAMLSEALAEVSTAMARAVFRFLGYSTRSTYEMTMQFLRWMLGLLFTKLGALARGALTTL